MAAKKMNPKDKPRPVPNKAKAGKGGRKSSRKGVPNKKYPMALAGTDLAADTEAWQVMLEGHRRNPDDEELYLDMLKAKRAMEISWLAQKHEAS